MKEMVVKHAETDADLTVGEVARAAAKIFRNKYKGPMLVSWYDRRHRRAGPMEACDRQPLKVALDYARSHGADTRITVDSGQRELFFRRTPPDTAELDREACLAIHRGLEHDRFENMMGG